MNRGIVWCPHCGSPHPLGVTVCPASAKTLERGVHAAAQAPENAVIGTVLGGKYRILRVIGGGATGEVFEAENVFLRRLVAVKVVRKSATADAVERLKREAQLVASVHHPNVCDVYDFGLLPDGSPFLVFERLFGETLGQRLTRTSRIDVDDAVDVFLQVLSGLQAAHGAQIIHRDLKPQNVFLADRLGCAPLVKILDFGFARDVSSTSRRLTMPGAHIGTVKYMAPEQILGDKAAVATDVFAVGLMLYECLAGVHPFAGPTTDDYQSNTLSREPRRLDRASPQVSRALADVVHKGLEKTAPSRWPTAAEFQRALQQAAGPRLEPLSSDDPPSSY